jgi:uncharacterized cupredoxin-like copper-binding protein
MGERMRAFALLPVVLVGLVGLAVAGCGSSSGETTPAASGDGNTVEVSAMEFAFDPGTIQIDQPGTYTFKLTNGGSFDHALEVEGQGLEEETETVAPGSSGEVTITFSKTGTYEFYCPIDGHRDKGMEGTLTVGAASAGGGTTEDNGGGGETDTDDSGGGSTDTGSSGGYGYG